MTGASSRRSLRLASLLAALLMALPAPSAEAATGVRTSRAVEFGPSAAQRVLAWTRAPRSRPRRFRAYLRLGSASPFRLSARGTKGFTAGGAVEENGNRVAYWEHSGGKGNIKIFHVGSRRRTAPGFVNTARHEWGAAISGKWLLFARGRDTGPMRVFIANLERRTVRRLARVGSGGYLAPGDVTGRWATWTRCPGYRSCRVVRQNLRTGNRLVVPNPRDQSHFAPSVLGNGTVVYAESGSLVTCGTRARLFVKPRSGERRRFETLPAGTSTGTTAVRRVSSSRVHVFWDQMPCADFDVSNIYRTRIAA